MAEYTRGVVLNHFVSGFVREKKESWVMSSDGPGADFVQRVACLNPKPQNAHKHSDHVGGPMAIGARENDGAPGGKTS